jgi:hypothetical protein
MFEDATFHSSGILPSKTPQWMLFTLAINLTFVATAIVVPLIYPGGFARPFDSTRTRRPTPGARNPAPAAPLTTVSRPNRDSSQ